MPVAPLIGRVRTRRTVTKNGLGELSSESLQKVTTGPFGFVTQMPGQPYQRPLFGVQTLLVTGDFFKFASNFQRPTSSEPVADEPSQTPQPGEGKECDWLS